MRSMTSNSGERLEGVIRFGDFKLDRARRRLSCRDVRLKLQPQPLRVLELLIEKAPATVSREEMFREVWGDDINVDVEQNLNYCIRQIRLALAEDLANPRFVETVPRQGYRFIAAVNGETENTVQQPPSQRRSNLRSWMLVGGTVFTAALLIMQGVRWTARAREQNGLPSNVSYVTTYPGDEMDPSFSPDGSQVAFSWDGNKSENRDIYVLPVGGQHPLRLTHDPADDISPAWSPDGLSIAFIRRADGHSGSIILIPALGGPERLLRTIRMAPQPKVTDIDQRRLAWSPDGKWLVFTNQLPAGDHALFLLSLETGATRPLFPGRASGFEDTSPAFSRDGRKLAFARFSGPPNSVLLIQRMTLAMDPEGEPFQVPNLGPRPHSPAWDVDGRLLFIDNSVIKRFEIGGPTKTVYIGDAHLRGLTVSASRLIAVRTPFNFDILAIPLRPGGLSATGPAEPLVSSTAAEVHPRFSPDGKQLAFVSDRGGSQELWLADADGGNPKQLTSLGAYIMGSPRWSPGGQQIAFHARVPDTQQIYVLDVAGGLPRQITNEVRGSGAPSWSDDGKTLYVGRMIPGRWFVYKVPAEGGKEEPVFSAEGGLPVAVPGGKLLLYAKTNSFGIFSRALDRESASSVEERLVDDYLPPNGGIYPFEDGIYYLSSTSAGVARAFRFYDFATKKSVDVAPAPAKIGLGLSVSPDRRRLAYCAEAEGNADLIMVEWR
jgi:Tol biopolymer transport system component